MRKGNVNGREPLITDPVYGETGVGCVPETPGVGLSNLSVVCGEREYGVAVNGFVCFGVDYEVGAAVREAACVALVDVVSVLE